jgi:uncharacterized iron-regulated protein
MAMNRFLKRFLIRIHFLLGCLISGAALHAAPDIIRAADQKPISRAQFIQVLNQADVVILGELHDNPDHHQIRGELITALARPGLKIVAEHLTLGQSVDFGRGLLAGLESAGFSSKAWAWPIHEPLFGAIQKTGLPLAGANLDSQQTSQVFKTKGESLPIALQALLKAAPLSQSQEEALHAELMQSHCGAMPASMLPGMTWAQRGRDAAMASAAMQSTPSILVAGNGHAWRDVGVPQIIGRNKPELKVISVLFQERSATGTVIDTVADAARADYVWLTAPISRPDPCQALRAMPKAK